jgi:hypothetical protein
MSSDRTTSSHVKTGAFVGESVGASGCLWHCGSLPGLVPLL